MAENMVEIVAQHFVVDDFAEYGRGAGTACSSVQSRDYGASNCAASLTGKIACVDASGLAFRAGRYDANAAIEASEQ